MRPFRKNKTADNWEQYLGGYGAPRSVTFLFVGKDADEVDYEDYH